MLYVYTVMSNYPLDLDDPMYPLPRRTAEELRAAAIGPPTREALSLALWEAYRLRQLARTLRAVLTSSRPGSLQDAITRAVARLDQEPCIAEGRHIDFQKRRREGIQRGDYARRRLAQLRQERGEPGGE